MTLICIHTYLGLRKKKYSKQKEVKENNTRVCRRPLSIFLPREFLLIPVVKQTDSNHTHFSYHYCLKAVRLLQITTSQSPSILSLIIHITFFYEILFA